MPKPMQLTGLALIAAGLMNVSTAYARCEPVDADFSVASALPSVPITVNLNDDHMLLGHQGERVAAQRQLITVGTGGDLMPQTWIDKVDWSAYRINPDANPGGSRAAPSRLVFDTDGRLCRIERYRTGRGAAQLEGGVALAYDANGALSGYVEYEETAGAGPRRFTAARRACLQRNAQGQLTAFVSDGCTTTGGSGPTRHYVRDSTGRLLRIVDTQSPQDALAVQIMDAQGKAGPRYVQRQPSYSMAAVSDAPYAYPDPPERSADRLLPLFQKNLSRLPTEVPDNDWRVVRIKDDVPLDEEDMVSWDPDTQIVLAQGKTDAQGDAVLSPAQQQQTWQAMRDYPWRVFFYRDPMSRVMLLPAMPPAQWKACSDPANMAEDACGG